MAEDDANAGGVVAGLTLRQARDQLSAAIDFGELASQHAPAGHAIFAAVADARAARDEVDTLIPFWSSGDVPGPERVLETLARVTGAVYDAAADLRVDPSTPLPKTLFPAAPPGPLSWVAVGAAGAALWLAWYFWGRGGA